MNVVVVSGASRGLGKAIASRFSQDKDWRVIGLGLSERPADLEEAIAYQQLDVTDPQKTKAFWQDLKLGLSDNLTLINNAGGYKGGKLIDSEADDFQNQITLNYLTGVQLTRSLVKSHAAARIFNIVSAAAWGPMAGNSAYAASKAAARQFYQSLQSELDPANFRLTNFYPDKIATSGPDDSAIDPDDLAQFIYWQAANPSSYYLRDVNLAATGKNS